MAAATGDWELKGKADWIVNELGRCQRENGGEWVFSIPEKYLHWVARKKAVWAPHYVVHKTLMGLVDMAKYAGSAQAMDILVKAANWFTKWTKDFNRQQMDDILEAETGGMMEAWADLYGMTGKEEHLELVRKYERGRLFDRLLAGDDALTNMHANTTIPEAHGAARAYEVTGDKRYRDIAMAYWDFAVPRRGFYATGGQNCGEIWSPPHRLAERLGEKTQEHCTVYNMMRLSQYLHRWTGDVKYADYYERNLYNGILAQQNPATGQIAYWLPMWAGGQKAWGTPTKTFWCCHGTLVQAHMLLYTANTFFADKDGLVASQYLPTSVKTERNGTPVRLWQTFLRQEREMEHRPMSTVIHLQVEADKPQEFDVKLRLPWWLAGQARLLVNGQPQEIVSKPSSYITIRRKWNRDKLRLELPKSLHAELLPGSKDMYAFMEGPNVLAGLVDGAKTLTGQPAKPETMLEPAKEREWGNWICNYMTRGQCEDFRLMPIHEIVDEKYTMYFRVKKPGKAK